MFVPSKWEMPKERHFSFMEKYGFATVVSADFNATHIPLLLDKANNQLIGHVARANPHWRQFDNEKTLAFFHGPHAYIAPNWYQDGPNVPTWNYAALHVKGTAQLLSPERTLDAVNHLVGKYQPALLQSGSVMTPEYAAKLSKGIVGFTIDIESIEAKEKLGQHRKLEDQQGVTEGLAASQHPDNKALLAYMRSIGVGLGIN